MQRGKVRPYPYYRFVDEVEYGFHGAALYNQEKKQFEFLHNMSEDECRRVKHFGPTRYLSPAIHTWCPSNSVMIRVYGLYKDLSQRRNIDLEMLTDLVKDDYKMPQYLPFGSPAVMINVSSAERQYRLYAFGMGECLYGVLLPADSLDRTVSNVQLLRNYRAKITHLLIPGDCLRLNEFIVCTVTGQMYNCRVNLSEQFDITITSMAVKHELDGVPVDVIMDNHCQDTLIYVTSANKLFLYDLEINDYEYATTVGAHDEFVIRVCATSIPQVYLVATLRKIYMVDWRQEATCSIFYESLMDIHDIQQLGPLNDLFVVSTGRYLLVLSIQCPGVHLIRWPIRLGNIEREVHPFSNSAFERDIPHIVDEKYPWRPARYGKYMIRWLRTGNFYQIFVFQCGDFAEHSSVMIYPFKYKPVGGSLHAFSPKGIDIPFERSWQKKSVYLADVYGYLSHSKWEDLSEFPLIYDLNVFESTPGSGTDLELMYFMSDGSIITRKLNNGESESQYVNFRPCEEELPVDLQHDDIEVNVKDFFVESVLLKDYNQMCLMDKVTPVPQLNNLSEACQVLESFWGSPLLGEQSTDNVPSWMQQGEHQVVSDDQQDAATTDNEQYYSQTEPEDNRDSELDIGVFSYMNLPVNASQESSSSNLPGSQLNTLPSTSLPQSSSSSMLAPQSLTSNQISSPLSSKKTPQKKRKSGFK
ncbi:hypothetical protein MIR68_012443 [Amoeboaphelidium protococcarum]|nr:hypothetical protein MIR68_012443 [Amoeboaphelidium protococcarum]